MPKHHHDHALKKAIFAHWQNDPCGEKTLLIFIEACVKIDQNAYFDQLVSKFLPWIELQDWPHGYVFYKNLESLKRSLIKAWDNIDASMLRACSRNKFEGLEAVVKANGGYIEEKWTFHNLLSLDNFSQYFFFFVN